MTRSQSIDIPCGAQPVSLDLPAGALVLHPPAPRAARDPRAAVEEALAAPAGSPPLEDLARGRGSAVVVVSDVTRPVPNQDLLPPILAALARGGLSRDRITILIATGMHRPNLGAELEGLVGPEVVRDYRVVNHDCHDRAAMVEIMRAEGHPVEINRLLVEADLKILTGLIEPHTFAGFSGGGKSVLPGVASFETMKFMHSFAMIQDPGVTVCRLEGNPFQDHVRRAAAKLKVDFMVNATIDKSKRLVSVFAGGLPLAHDLGCAAARGQMVVELDEPADLAVVSGGGLPLDATFYQASKGLMAARDMVRPGGAVLMVSGCDQGIGGVEFREIVCAFKDPREFFDHFCHPENFVIDQWGAQRFFQLRQYFGEIHLYAPGLEEELFAELGAIRVLDLQAALNDLALRFPRVVVSPQGPYLAAQVRDA